MPTSDSNVIPLNSDSSSLERTEREALSQLFSEYGENLRRDLRRSPSPPDDIDDAIQETFYRVLHGGHLRNLDTPSAFLFRTAKNILIDRYRKNRLEINFNSHYQLNANADAREDMLLEYSELTIAYQKALSELPRKCRQVFLMRRYDGLTNSEIAANLRISTRMVQKHMIRALVHFDKCLR